MTPHTHCNSTPPMPTLQRCVGLLLFILTTTAHADQLLLSGIAQPGVEVFNITGGKVVYLSAAGTEISTPLAEVDAIYIDALPQVQQGDAAMTAGEPAEAVPLYRAALAAAGRKPWQQQWITARLVASQDAAGMGAGALESYAALLTSGADPALAMSPPIASVSVLTDAEKQRLAPVMQRITRSAPPALKAVVAELSKAATPVASATSTTESTASPTTTPTTPAPAATAATASAPTGASGIRLPAQLVSSDNPALPKLKAGLFIEAMGDLNGQLKVEQTRLADRLFLLGVAQRGVADRSGLERDYMDTALSFMRVAIYFPSSNLSAPALLEAGDAHRKAGLEDRAAKLTDEGRAQLDEEAEPVYAQWLSGG